MDNKFSTIKERCLQVAKCKGYSYEDFCYKIGMTYGNFKGSAKKTPLNSNAIENILSEIPDVNLYWLLTGEGEMLKPESLKPEGNLGQVSDPDLSKIIGELTEVIRTQAKALLEQQQLINATIMGNRNSPPLTEDSKCPENKGFNG